MIPYDEFLERSTFSQVELLAFAHATLIDDPPEGFECRLPTPPMLMFDRVVELNKARRGGRIVAERKVHIDDWFFQCHFKGDPVQPGCLGVDAIWQLLGFYCAQRAIVRAGPSAAKKSLSKVRFGRTTVSSATKSMSAAIRRWPTPARPSL